MQTDNFEEICEIGHGGEATVYIHLRRVFPFFEKMFKTKRDFVVSYRVLHKVKTSSSELLIKRSFSEFLRHLIAKKFDDYFLRKGYYKYPHIPRLLGFDINGYYYEFVYGLEGYYPLYFDDTNMNWNPVALNDERISSSLYHEVGIYLFQDIVEPTSNYVKNLIIEEPYISLMPENISSLWKRIDFGVKSIKFDYEKIKKYIEKNEKELNEVLLNDRVEMLLIALDYLIKDGNSETFGEKKFDRLKYLIELFLKSTLEHMGIIEENPEHLIIQKKEGRYKKLKLKTIKIKKENYKFLSPAFNKKIFENNKFGFELVLSSEVSSMDSIIITHSEVPMAKIEYKEGNKGFILFLTHFLIKKFEDYFITTGFYSFPHIPRPLGYWENHLLYEFPFGKQILKKTFIDNKKVDDLENVYNLFFNIGIDFMKNLSYFEDKIKKEKVAFEFFVSQPENSILEKFSRMWQRAIFTEEDLNIDYDKIEKFLFFNKEIVNKNLSKGRYETMVLAVKYLKNEIDESEFKRLKNGILKFRISSLRHYNPKEIYIFN